MVRELRQKISRVLTGCCTVLWLAGLLSVGQGNLTAHWTVSHCPQGQAQNGQQSHNHCAWHCSGFDIQSGDGRAETTADLQVGLVWSLGTIPAQHARLDGQFPPRGPPQRVFEIA
ncbi:MAG: hypothetical protein U0223_10360 [Nitrospira sp.]|nr:hypothetical protein [Nitrospira sp.]